MIKQKIKDNLRSVKRTVKNFQKKWKNSANLKSDVLWVSIGENCLSDDILRRHNRKSYSSVFSSGRSNIEYVVQMEKDDYKYLLKKESLQRFRDGNHSVVRSTCYKECSGKYSPRHMLGFEFSHHDPLQVREDNRAFRRRISRQLKFRGARDFVFLYHHRITVDSDLSLIRTHLNELLSLYNIKGHNCKAVLFYQSIIAKDCDKSLDFNVYGTDLLEFVCYTHDLWAGDNLETFWAKKDDDLFAEMFSKVDAVNKRNIKSELLPAVLLK